MRGRENKEIWRHKSLFSFGSKRTVKRLRSNKENNSIHAVLRDTFPFANGLSFVLFTFLSKLRSQISFAIHPAPLTKTPPKTINPRIKAEGGADGVNQRAHPAGISSISLPLGLFHLRS